MNANLKNEGLNKGLSGGLKIRRNMKTGDIILTRHMLCPMAWFICFMLGCKYSHVAFALNDEYIVEVTPWGKKITHLSHYTNSRYTRVKILRVKNCNAKRLRWAVKRAVCGMPVYSYWSFLKVIWNVFRNTGKKLDRLTCSGFVGYWLYSIGINISNTNYPCYITPKDLEKSNKLKDV